MKCKLDILLWAESGWGKTSQIFNLAEHLYSTEGLKTRLVSNSGGGWAVGQALVDLGVVVPTHLEQRPYTQESISRLVDGWWPEDPADPHSPLQPPPPTKAQLAGKYRNFSGEFQSQSDWDEIGLYAFDSLSEIADKLKRHLRDMGANRKTVASDSEKSMTRYKDGDTYFGSTTRGTYGTVQDYMKDFVARSQALGNKYVIWTALPHIGEEEQTRNAIYGPEVVGKAKTDAAKAWCSNCLHGDLEEVTEGTKRTTQRRLWLKPHYDAFGTKMVAKNSANFWSQTEIPDCLSGKDLQFEIDQPSGLVKFINLLRDAQRVAEKKIAAIKQKGA